MSDQDPSGKHDAKPRDRQVAIALISAAAIVLAALIPVLAPLYHPSTRHHTSTSPQPTKTNPTTPVYFHDALSAPDNNGWDDSGGSTPLPAQGGFYQDGAYSYYSSAPYTIYTSGPSVSSLPTDVRVEVEARLTVANGTPAFGVACRLSRFGRYDFLIGTGFAEIAKLTVKNPGASAQYKYKSLSLAKDVGFDPKDINKIWADCSSGTGSASVHLALWVNGKAVVQETDSKNPLPNGTVAIAVGNNSNLTAKVGVNFTDFTVTKP